MKKTTKVIISAGIATLLSHTACAQSGIYISGALGWSQQQGMPTPKDIGAISESTQPFSGNISLGYNHDFSTFFGLGLEAGWSHFASTTYDSSMGGSEKLRS